MMQAVQDIRADILNLAGRGILVRERVDYIAVLMRAAMLFDFAFYPDNEHIYFATECVNEGVFALPFEVTFFTWRELDFQQNGFSAALLMDGKDQHLRCICFSKGHVGGWFIDVAFGLPLRGSPMFVPHQCGTVFHPQNKRVENTPDFFGICESTPQFLTEHGRSIYGARSDEHTQNHAQHFWETIRGLVIALNSKSVGAETVRTSRQVLRAAARRREWCPVEHKSVSLILPGNTYKSGDRIGTHNSPRMHWRRGHFRRLDGRVIPVSPCIVGTAGTGVITHEYKAKLASGGRHE